MKLLLFFLLGLLSQAFLIPVPTDQERCMIVYSLDHEDTIKITVKTPTDPTINDFYDYIA